MRFDETDGAGVIDAVAERIKEKVIPHVPKFFVPGVEVQIFNKIGGRDFGRFTVTDVNLKMGTLTFSQPLPKGIKRGCVILLAAQQ